MEFFHKVFMFCISRWQWYGQVIDDCWKSKLLVISSGPQVPPELPEQDVRYLYGAGLNFCFVLFWGLIFQGVFLGGVKVTPASYGGSQARGWMGATAASLNHSHSNTVSEPHLWTIPQLRPHQILNPLSKARDQTHILLRHSRNCQCWFFF